MTLSRRAFLKVTGATSLALAAGPARWGWALPGSPFAELQDDPLLRLPEGYSYRILAETFMPMTGGRGPFPRPEFPDLNVAFPTKNGGVVLSTSHEIQATFPFPFVSPQEEYDRIVAGAITSLRLDKGFNVVETAYNAGGMVNNCSGSGTPWGTVLTAEEDTGTFEADHGFIWEVDVNKHTKTRLDACGRFDHETGIVDPKTGYVYLTEDSGSGLLYRMRPTEAGRLEKGGLLEAYRADRSWVPITDPLGEEKSPQVQGRDQGALAFERLEGGCIDGRYFYFTETEDDTACGKIWRLQLESNRLDLYATGSYENLCMPDNIALDAKGNLFACEDKPVEERPQEIANRIIFIDRNTGKMAPFAQVTSPIDELTGPEFSPDGNALFLNLQRSLLGGVTVVIEGPFAKGGGPRRGVAARPTGALSEEESFLRGTGAIAGLPLAAAAGLINLRRRGLVDDVPNDVEDAARELGAPQPVETPKKRVPKTF